MIYSDRKRTCSLATAGILISTFAAAIYRMPSGPSGRNLPSAYVGKPVVDLGNLEIGDTREIEFQIQNKGNQRLVINRLEGPCGCDHAVNLTTIIPPNGEDRLTVAIDTRHAVGVTEHSAHFTTNDPSQPRLTLTVRAIVTAATCEEDYDIPVEDRNLSILIPN
jgi:hypothetical protein